MTTRATLATATAAALLAASAHAQQVQADRADQAQDPQAQDPQAQGQQAQQGEDRQQGQAHQGGGRGQAAPAAPTVVLTFTAEDVQGDDFMAQAADTARAPYVAQITVSSEAQGAASGVLVFETLGRFSDWRDDGMSEFFEPFGGAASVETTLRAFRADLLQASDPRSAVGSEDMTVEYTNTDNDAAGDAEIDAVTVVCPGDDAECSPSN